ncbi:bHLH-PAS protein-like [Tropilaelaps mercedesae]|uniref:BHLH-PAS protein-like n=1 Tax=Tropilaelaps mercedesae TaxID=418985 RepID=A0A1V9XTJ6_9ACAR|nr:bHLH-PAS protein-like [Tropilaelaps mercedesae]
MYMLAGESVTCCLFVPACCSVVCGWVQDAACDPVSSPLTYEVLDDTKARKKYNGGSGGGGKNRKRPAASDSPEDGGVKEKKEISELSRPWKSGTSDNSNVKDLEDAMKKHLPPPPISQAALDTNGKLGPQPPTIQWIGAPAPTTPPSATSSLLRQLYVNRETVIRQSNQPAGNGRSPYTPYGDVAPADAYHHSHGDFMLHHNPAGLSAPYNSYEAYPQSRDNLVPGMMTPVATLPSMTSMTTMQRHVPYELPLRPQVLAATRGIHSLTEADAENLNGSRNNQTSDRCKCEGGKNYKNELLKQKRELASASANMNKKDGFCCLEIIPSGA